MREFSRKKGFFVASALPSWIWGPHDSGPSPSGRLVIDAIAHKLPPMLPPGGSAVVDARDVAAGMLSISEIGRSGERYILSGGFVQLADIITNLAESTGTKPPTRRIPFAAAVALATATETWSRITGAASPMSVEAIRLMNARLYVTSAKAEKELGASFRPFAGTLADTLSWASNRLTRGSHSALIQTNVQRGGPLFVPPEVRVVIDSASFAVRRFSDAPSWRIV